MLSNELRKLLDKREFIQVATCDLKGRPNSAPKFLLKTEEGHIYLVDYIIGTTWQNLTINPRASLSFMDNKTLKGYQFNGSVKIIDKGRLYDKMSKEMLEKEIRLTTEHIIEDVRGLSKHDNFEVLIRDKFIILKFRVEEVVEIGIRGDLVRTNLPKDSIVDA